MIYVPIRYLWIAAALAIAAQSNNLQPPQESTTSFFLDMISSKIMKLFWFKAEIVIYLISSGVVIAVLGLVFFCNGKKSKTGRSSKDLEAGQVLESEQNDGDSSTDGDSNTNETGKTSRNGTMESDEDCEDVQFRSHCGMSPSVPATLGQATVLPQIYLPQNIESFVTFKRTYSSKLADTEDMIADLENEVVTSDQCKQRLERMLMEQKKDLEETEQSLDESKERSATLQRNLEQHKNEKRCFVAMLEDVNRYLVKNAETYSKDLYAKFKIRMSSPAMVPTSQYGTIQFKYYGEDKIVIENLETNQKLVLCKAEKEEKFLLKVTSYLLRQNSHIHLRLTSMSKSFLPFVMPVLVLEIYEAVKVLRDGHHLVVSTDFTDATIRPVEKFDLYTNLERVEEWETLSSPGRVRVFTFNEEILPRDDDTIFKVTLGNSGRSYSYFWKYVKAIEE